MNDEIFVLKQSTALRLERELIMNREPSPIVGIDPFYYGARIVAVPDNYLIKDVPVGYTLKEIFQRFYPYRSKKRRIRNKWFKRHGYKYL